MKKAKTPTTRPERLIAATTFGVIQVYTITAL
jgi:hypothetical protein